MILVGWIYSQNYTFNYLKVSSMYVLIKYARFLILVICHVIFHGNKVLLSRVGQLYILDSLQNSVWTSIITFCEFPSAKKAI